MHFSALQIAIKLSGAILRTQQSHRHKARSKFRQKLGETIRVELRQIFVLVVSPSLCDMGYCAPADTFCRI